MNNKDGFKDYFELFKRELVFTFWRDRRRGILILLAASAYLLIFSLLYAPGIVKEIPTVVYDQSQSGLSRGFIQAIDDSDAFAVEAQALSEEELQQYIKTHREFVTFYIPGKFSERVKAGHHTEVLMNVDGTNIVILGTASTGAIDVVRGFSSQESIHHLEQVKNQLPYRAMQRIEPIQISYRMIGNSTLNYQVFFVLGLALAAFQQGIFLSVAASLLHETQGIAPVERYMNSFLRLFVKILPYALLSLLSFTLMVTISVSVLQIPFVAKSFWPLFLLMSSFSFVLCALTAVVASLVDSEISFTRISIIYTIPAFLLSGFTWPLEAMPMWVQNLSYLFPFTYVATTFRTYFLTGHVTMLTAHSVGMALVGTILFIVGAKLYNRRIEKQYKQ